MIFPIRPLACACVLVSLILPTGPARAADAPATQPVPVVDGIVQPREPLAEQLVRAMAFLKKADGDYVPGKIDGPLAGYYSSAHVMPDGSRAYLGLRDDHSVVVINLKTLEIENRFPMGAGSGPGCINWAALQ